MNDDKQWCLILSQTITCFEVTNVCMFMFDPQTLLLWRGLIRQESVKFRIYIYILYPWIYFLAKILHLIKVFCCTLQGELEMKITVSCISYIKFYVILFLIPTGTQPIDKNIWSRNKLKKYPTCDICVCQHV